MGPSDSTSVKGVIVEQQKFSELPLLTFPDEILQDILQQRYQGSWIKVKEIHRKVRSNKYVRCKLHSAGANNAVT